MASFSIMAVLGADISGFVSGMNSAKGAAANASSSISGGFGGMAMGIGRKVAGVAAAIGVTSFAKDMVAMGGKIADLSAKLGISTDDVQAWDYALSLSGGSIEEASKAFTKLGQSINKANNGDKEAIKHFTDIGIAVDTLRGKTAGPVMLEIAKKFGADGADGSKMEGALLGLAGKSSDSMFAAFRSGAAGNVEEFVGSRMGVSESDIEALDAAGDKYDNLVQRVKKLGSPFVAFGADKLLIVVQQLEKPLAQVGVIWGTIAAGASKIANVLGVAQAVATGAVPQPKESPQSASKKKAAALRGEMEARDGTDQKLSAAEQKKANSDALAVARAREQLELEERKGRLAAMTATQRAATLRDEADTLRAMAEYEPDELKKTKLLTDAQKIQNEIDDDERKDGKKKAKDTDVDALKAKPPERNMVNSLQQMGTVLGKFTTAPEVVALDLQRRSEDHLQAIRRGISKIASSGGFGSQDES